MFRVRRIYHDVTQTNQSTLAEVRTIFLEQFPGAPRRDIDELPARLRDPVSYQFKTTLFVAENGRGHVTGFAIVLHEPIIHFCYLLYIASAKRNTGRGVGAALYEHIRDDALQLGAKGLFFECLPDTKEGCADPVLRKLNSARMRFYETYGARPILGTHYQTPVHEGHYDNLPYLMYDDLDTKEPLQRDFARDVVRAILEGQYGDICSEEYVAKVVESFADDPIAIRPFRFTPLAVPHRQAGTLKQPMVALTVNDKHNIHHIRERGYVESPVRISSIARELAKSGLFRDVAPADYSFDHIVAVHAPELVDYLRTACENAPAGKSVYPYVFPIRNPSRPPKDLSVCAGYYCIDTFTPINRNAFPAAKRAVDCALTAAFQVWQGTQIAYALVRPPGHHAEHRVFGGFCYFNNAAVAAHYLSDHGKVAILDIDYHHGNGQQDIFYERSDVLTVSIHGSPDFAYPYFTGFAEEIGAGAGEGFNLNIALPEIQDGPQYRMALAAALQRIIEFAPRYLVVCLGLDPAKGDPTGTWLLTANDFEANGRMIGQLGLPTLVVQEGGYRTRTLGVNARRFFQGLVDASNQAAR